MTAIVIPPSAKRFIARLLLLVLGIGLTVSAMLFLLATKLSAASYATTTGYVTGSTVASSSCSSASYRSNRSVRYTCYQPEISYTYNVGGRTYSGDGLYDGWSYNYSSAGEAAAALAPFRSRATVTVYYQPSDPESSALVLGAMNHWIWILGGVGIVLIAVSRLIKKTEPGDGEAPEDVGVQSD